MDQFLDDGNCSLEFLGVGGGSLTHNSRGSGRLPAGMNTSSKKPSVTVPRHDERWVSMVRLNMSCCVPRDKASFAARACVRGSGQQPDAPLIPVESMLLMWPTMISSTKGLNTIMLNTVTM